jgi:hypothetical protein
MGRASVLLGASREEAPEESSSSSATRFLDFGFSSWEFGVR